MGVNGSNRRDLLRGAGLMLATTLTDKSCAQGGMDPLAPPASSPTLAWEFSIRIAWANGRQPTGKYRSGQRIHNTVAGGSFAGPRLEGEVLPGGGDWAIMNPPDADLVNPEPGRSVVYDARYILRTDDGTHLYVTNRGGKFTEATTVLTLGLSQPVFDVPIDSPYQFLARNIWVGLSEARPTETILRVFRVVV